MPEKDTGLDNVPGSLNIALLVGSLGLGGAERQCVELAKVLHRKGHEVHVLYFNTEHTNLLDELGQAGVPAIALPYRFKGDVRPIWRLARWFRQERVNVVHTFLFTAGYLGRIAALFAHVPVVVHGERNARAAQRSRQRWMDRLLAHRTDKFVANSQAGGKILRDTIRVPSEKIVVIQNGVNTDRFGGCGAPHDPPVVVSVGRLWPQKNYETALRAIATCARESKFEYWIVGGSGRSDKYLIKYHQMLQEVTSELGVRDSVRWLGYREDVPDIFRQSDVFLSTSWHEGMPNAVLEAMAAGLPVIVSGVSDNAIVVRDSIDGFVVDDASDVRSFAARLNILLADPDLRLRMGGRARERIQQEYSVETMVIRHESLYSGLLVAREN